MNDELTKRIVENMRVGISINIPDEHAKRIEVDMLDGNICRICVSDSVDEIEKMELFAFARIRALKEYRIRQIKMQDHPPSHP